MTRSATNADIDPRRVEPAVAVVVVTLDRPGMLDRTLRSLADLSVVPAECVVVDQGTPRDFADAFAPLRKRGVRCERVESNYRSISAARNLGAARVSADVVLYVDDDVTFESEVVARHAERYEDPQVAAVAGHVTCPPGDEAFVRKNTFAPKGAFVDSGRGCHMSFRRETLSAVGGFNPYIRNSGDETELFARLRRSGRRVANAPEAVVKHWVHPSGGNRGGGTNSADGSARVIRDGLVRAVCLFGLAGLLWPIKNRRAIRRRMLAERSVLSGIVAAMKETVRGVRLGFRARRDRRDYFAISESLAAGIGLNAETGLPRL